MSSSPPPEPAAEADRVRALLAALDDYRQAREKLFVVLGHTSNRDPLAEVAEHLVAALMGGTLAANRVQKAWDVELLASTKAQVKYLANTNDTWVNEHVVHRIDGVDWYVLVIIQGFRVHGVLAFPSDLRQIGNALGKQHPAQETTLQFTRANWLAIRADPNRFRELKMRIWLPPFG
jgi:hypothetical protein